jgi:AcrR family transcriptional regulator
MPSPGLREIKKTRTRQLISDAAARLFAERGYEQVSVRDVAREAEVAEQTVYNYFPAKEQLVSDREQRIQDGLCDLNRSRPAGINPAAAVREFILDGVGGIRTIKAELWRGEIGYLAVISPTVHRLTLELIDRLAIALAGAIVEKEDVAPEVARLQGIALAGVYQIIIGEAGRRTQKGHSPTKVARDLRPIVEHVMDELDLWFSGSGAPSPPRSRRS